MHRLRALFFGALSLPLALAAIQSIAEESVPNKFPIGPSLKEIVLVTDSGLDPQKITLRQLDGSVFFVNGTKDSLLSITVAFGSKRAHCASENLKIDGAGNLASVEPIGPRDFAIMCFPDRGSYPVTVSGVGAGGKTVTGEVVVE